MSSISEEREKKRMDRIRSSYLLHQLSPLSLSPVTVRPGLRQFSPNRPDLFALGVRFAYLFREERLCPPQLKLI